MQDRISELESKSTEFESDLEAQILNNGDLQEEVERKESMLDEANDKIRDLEIQISQIQTEKDESVISYKNEVEKAALQIFELEKKLETIQSEKDGFVKEISALESAKEMIEKDLKTKMSSLEDVLKENREKIESMANLEIIR
jgi:predicted  nucleic acid-binding Zn-ribbon protein